MFCFIQPMAQCAVCLHHDIFTIYSMMLIFDLLSVLFICVFLHKSATSKYVTLASIKRDQKCQHELSRKFYHIEDQTKQKGRKILKKTKLNREWATVLNAKIFQLLNILNSCECCICLYHIQGSCDKQVIQGEVSKVKLQLHR